MLYEHKSAHGGAGRGQGRKPKYKEPTKTVSFRVPSSKVEIIKKIVTDKLKQFKKAAVKKALLTFSLIIFIGCNRHYTYQTITFEGIANDPPYKGARKMGGNFDKIIKLNDSTYKFRFPKKNKINH